MTDGSVRVLYVRTEGRGAEPRADRRLRELSGEVPRRVLVEEALGFDLLGESDIRDLAGRRGRMLRALPLPVALAAEAWRRSPEYDVILTWAERFTVAVAGAMLLRGRRRPRHVAILDWVSKPVVRIPLRLVRGGVDRVLTWSSVQAEVCTTRIGFRPDQVRRIEHPVDEAFFAPGEDADAAPREGIVSAGETQRDFPTLIRAIAGSGIPTTIAANQIGAFGGFRTRLRSAQDVLEAPAGVTVGPLSARELRAAYASAVAVVVPLVPAENNAGISVVLEAMAMARPVIVTRTVGQVDVVEDGETGFYVRAGDAAQLRARIDHLRENPAEADEIGRRGRAEVLARHRTADFVAAVRAGAS